jgi:hypothetical protein
MSWNFIALSNCIHKKYCDYKTLSNGNLHVFIHKYFRNQDVTELMKQYMIL